MMLCPFHLMDVTTFKKESKERKIYYVCPECNAIIPTFYVEKYKKYPPVVVNAIGFRAHGKTVYFAALFYALKKLNFSKNWEDFFTMPLDNDSLKEVYRNADMLENGALPPPNQKNFERPTILRVEGIPMYPNCTMLFYDVSGESFEDPDQLVSNAFFVKNAKTAMFLISPSDLGDINNGKKDDFGVQMHRLLTSYAIGMQSMGADTKKQSLVVVYTKADEMIGALMEHKELYDYLISGTIDGVGSSDRYIKNMNAVSRKLRQFTLDNLSAHEFMSTAKACFKSIDFCMVSSLGSRPQGDRLTSQIKPCRILDPILWMIHKSLPNTGRLWRRIKG